MEKVGVRGGDLRGGIQDHRDRAGSRRRNADRPRLPLALFHYRYGTENPNLVVQVLSCTELHWGAQGRRRARPRKAERVGASGRGYVIYAGGSPKSGLKRRPHRVNVWPSVRQQGALQPRCRPPTTSLSPACSHRIGLGHFGKAENSSRCSPILDNERLPEQLRHLVQHDAACSIRRAPRRWERADRLDRPARPLILIRGRNRGNDHANLNARHLGAPPSRFAQHTLSHSTK